MRQVGRIGKDGREEAGLPLMESFYSIQGEGYHQGKAAWFIRLGGCDVGCVWCDVKESWDADAWPKTEIGEIMKPVWDSPAQLVVVTGGEPLLYHLDSLTSAIHKAEKAAHLETSGTHALSGEWDWVCLSPKKFRQPQAGMYERADELKIVVYNKSDLKWAGELVSLVNRQCRLYLQPEWSRRDKVLPLIVEFVKEDPRWEISLQIHKYMHVP